MRTALWIVISIIVILLAVLVIDAAGRAIKLTGISGVRIEKSRTAGSTVLFVYYQGILAKPETSSEAFRDVLLENGDVMLVHWGGDRFKAAEVVRMVTRAIMERSDDYTTVVFVGSSMGGLLSYDTGLLLNKLQPDLEQKYILLDPPTGRSDFQAPLDKISYIANVSGGPITNLFSRWYFEKFFVEPKEDNIEHGVDRRKLANHLRDAKSFSISMNNDWIRYITGHGAMIPGALKGLDAVYVRSSRDDDTVRPEAYDAWKQVFGGELPRLEVDSAHNAFNEMPNAWRSGFRRALQEIGIR
jgi:pimeloyl-ACP methyl ester carboxylesterase